MKHEKKYYSWARTRGLSLLYFLLVDLVLLLTLITLFKPEMAVKLWIGLHIGGLIVGSLCRGIILFEEL